MSEVKRYAMPIVPGGRLAVPQEAEKGFWCMYQDYAKKEGSSMRVLVACEFSGIVRDAFRRKGHDAWSCDLLPCEGDPRYHYQQDVREVLHNDWDLMIAHPPCDHLAVSGARWFAEKRADGRQGAAIDFFMMLVNAPIELIAIENPIGIMSTRYRKPDQIIQPWQFGHGETKATCLWLKNLPLLEPTNIVDGREARVHKMPPGPNRGKERSRTYPGIAYAMAEQWGMLAQLRTERDRLADALDETLDRIRTFRIWFEDDYTEFVNLPDDDPLLDATARLGLTGRAEEILEAYRRER